MVIFATSPYDRFLSQMTFATKIILALDKSYMTLIATEKEIWMKSKINKIHFCPLIGHICIVVSN
jgi:hypothetical protein